MICFCARLCYSDLPTVFAYCRQNEEGFWDAFIHMFLYFGGIQRRVIFNNGKIAVEDGFVAHAKKRGRVRGPLYPPWL